MNVAIFYLSLLAINLLVQYVGGWLYVQLLLSIANHLHGLVRVISLFVAYFAVFVYIMITIGQIGLMSRQFSELMHIRTPSDLTVTLIWGVAIFLGFGSHFWSHRQRLKEAGFDFFP